MMDTYVAYASRGKNDWWRYLLSPVFGLALTALIVGPIYYRRLIL